MMNIHLKSYMEQNYRNYGKHLSESLQISMRPLTCKGIQK